MASLQPSAPNSCASASPNPRDPPVIRTTLPFKSAPRIRFNSALAASTSPTPAAAVASAAVPPPINAAFRNVFLSKFIFPLRRRRLATEQRQDFTGDVARIRFRREED